MAAGVRAGHPDAVGTVYTVLSERLLGYLMARVRDRATAEDLLELTFMELLRKGHTIRGGPAAIKVWLFQAAHFNALDHLRRVTRRAEDFYDDPALYDAEDHRPGPEELAVAADTTRRVRAAMAELSEDQRQVLLLRYVAGLSAPEVADVLAKSDGAVRSLQHRGERSLARLLTGQESLGDHAPDVQPSRQASPQPADQPAPSGRSPSSQRWNPRHS